MTITAILLVILSTFMHAGWNLFSKKHSPSIGFFQLATLGTVFWFSPIFFLTANIVPKIPLNLWAILMAAGFFQAIYYAGLAGAYARGALSIAYPLARSLPLLILVGVTFALGRGNELSLLALVGMTAIVTGVVILPMNSFRDFKLSNYLNPSCLLALIAATGTAGYSFLDKIGMNLLEQIPGTVEEWSRALLYLVLECIFTALWLQLLLQFTKRSRSLFLAQWSSLIRPAFLAGLAIGATYGIILLAMTHASNVSYIVGLRQLSIPIGTLYGIFLLKEQATPPRFFGVGILFIGLVFVALG